MVGDPRWSPHPVEIIGHLINSLRVIIESISKNNPIKLKIGGILLTILVTTFSGFCGWTIEQIAVSDHPIIKSFGLTSLFLGLSSSLASKSLRDSVLNTLKPISKNKKTYNLEL